MVADVRLRIDDLDAHHGPGQVLHGVSLQVPAGECLALLGRNGMGKTTLVRTVMGLHPASSGSVSLDGRAITDWPPRDRHAAGVELVAQGHRVFRSLTVAENLAVVEGIDLVRRDRMLERFPILSDRLHQRADSLSGGQQKMLMVARALVTDARLVLMDEPSEGLDPTRIRRVAEAVRDLTAAGTAVLLVEQRLGFALEVADRVAVIERGAIVSEAPADQARADPTALRRELGLA